MADETDEIIVQYERDKSEGDSENKKQKTFPPVGIGGEFKVKVVNESKWPLSQFRCSQVLVPFVRTPKGFRCLSPGCANCSFAEDDDSRCSSLYHLHMHAMTHAPELKVANRDIRSMFGTRSTDTRTSSAPRLIAASNVSPAAMPHQPTRFTALTIENEPRTQVNVQEGSTLSPIVDDREVRSLTLCQGYPWKGKDPMVDNYPFALHGSHLTLPWIAATNGILRSTRCSNIIYDPKLGSTCLDCLSLEENGFLLDILERSDDEELHLSHTTNIYLSPFQLRLRMIHHKHRADFHRLIVFGRETKFQKATGNSIAKV